MSIKEFWHCTPRKLAALSLAHAEINAPKKKSSLMTIDGVPVKSIADANPKKAGVGAPNAFIDQITFPK